MKKLIALLASVSLILSLSACKSEENIESSSNNISETSEIVEDSQNKNKELSTINLKNFMSEKEKNSVSVGNITLSEESDNENIVEIEWWEKEKVKDYLEDQKEYYFSSDKEYEKAINFLDENPDIKVIERILIDGRDYIGINPPFNYNGEPITLSFIFDSKSIISSFSLTKGISESLGEFKKWYKEYFDVFKEDLKEAYQKDVEDGIMTQEEVDQTCLDMSIVWQSVIDGTYKELETRPRTVSDWGFDKEYNDVVAISDFIREISIYDEELDTTFIVHITLPPNFDENKTYPIFMMTDGVWRLGNHPALRKLMEEGKTEDVLLASIGYDFGIDGTTPPVRTKYFYGERQKFLEFITNNLMPYISENYNIDFERSGLYGHSAGGVFSHYAAFNSDKFENQPFQYYIIGSPAFWDLYQLEFYDLPAEKNPDYYKSEYGYFDRKDVFNKNLYICGGENEDPEYEEYYGENDSTLEGIENLINRLKSHGVTTIESKIYEDSNHYEFIPSMFEEFFLKYYGKK